MGSKSPRFKVIKWVISIFSASQDASDINYELIASRYNDLR